MPADPHQDLHESTEILIDQITHLRRDANTTSEEKRAASYLYDAIMNYRAMLRKRPLTGAYEFISPPGGIPGWYYRCNTTDPKAAFNWKGPYPSRKAAVEARTYRPNNPKTRLAFIEQKLGLVPKETASV
jgi:hypothetical protein